MKKVKKSKKLKLIPKFKNEDKEREFWATHDSTEYIDWSKAVINPVFPNLKPSTESISLRLPKYLLERIKQLANAKDVPYQSLMKIFLAERVKKELRYS
ncbi:BrnA antitoxin family protein [Candidatus Microgenomates bacterium]|nr:BrnA antitoxin family protein [Candidatus Microgenomates bacterium]